MDYRDHYFRWAAEQVLKEHKYKQKRKETPNMSMKDVFLKLFRGHDPLDCINDFVLKTCINDADIVEVTMTIPTGYGPNAPFRLGSFKERKLEDKKLFTLPERIIFSELKTIVIWNDGTKTIVSCAEYDEYDEYDAFCAALAKKMFGSTSAAKRYLSKHSIYPAPKKKKEHQQSETIEYDVNCDCEAMEVETVPRDYVECDCESQPEPVSCEDCDSYVDAVPCEGGC